MNQSNKDTDDILDAIKSMMSNDKLDSEQQLPKDIIELTKPINEKMFNFIKSNQNNDEAGINKSNVKLCECIKRCTVTCIHAVKFINYNC